MSELYTIATPGESKVTEKMSRFYGFARHAGSVEQAKEIIRTITNEYHDARHVCWAYTVGVGSEMRSLCNDNGEPSGTAGRPIQGQLTSFSLTDTVVVVVRYFGGIKLGTGGLTVAYRTAAREAIENAELCERPVMQEISFTFPYIAMNEVMKIVKGNGVDITGQQFDNTCFMSIRVREADAEAIRQRLFGLSGVTAAE